MVGLEMFTCALSLYRSQNVLGWSNFFVLDQKFIYILWQSQTFSVRQKYDLHSVKLFFVLAQKIFWSVTKSLGPAQYVNKFLVQQKKIGPAQNILGPVKGQGINATKQRVRHHCAGELNAVDSKSTFVVGTNK